MQIYLDHNSRANILLYSLMDFHCTDFFLVFSLIVQWKGLYPISVEGGGGCICFEPMGLRRVVCFRGRSLTQRPM